MKKFILSSTALVAASSAAFGLDVSLNGEISIETKIDVAQSGFSGAEWDTGFTLKASGESMGWTYGGTIEVAMAQTAGMNLSVGGAEVYMGGDFMGKVSIKDSCGNFVDDIHDATGFDAADEVEAIGGGHCLEWSGFEMGGLGLNVAMGLDQGSNDLVVGASYLNPSLGKFSAEYDLNSENLDVEAFTKLGDYVIGVGVDYNPTESNGTGDVDYVVTASGNVAGFDVAVVYSPSYALSGDTIDFNATGEAAGFSDTVNGVGDGGKALGVEVGYDCFTLALGLDLAGSVDATYEGVLTAAGVPSTLWIEESGLIGQWDIEADCKLHDGVNFTASLGAESARAEVLQELNDPNGVLEDNVETDITGSIGMTVTF